MAANPASAPRSPPSNPAALRRGLLQDLSGLLADIAAARAIPAPEVHAHRKRLKRARATLALLRPALAEQAFEVCEQHLRTAGRTLAPARDAAALALARQRILTKIGLAPPRRRARRAVPNDRRTTATASQAARLRRELKAAATSLNEVKLRHARGWRSLGDGFRRLYRRGRIRVPTQPLPPSDVLHAWRRHVKRYWHALELFEPVNPRRLGPLIRQARALSDVLGEEHDLALLEVWMKQRSRATSPEDARVLREIASRRERLARRAVRDGRRLYAAKPRECEAALRQDWEQWLTQGEHAVRRVGTTPAA